MRSARRMLTDVLDGRALELPRGPRSPEKRSTVLLQARVTPAIKEMAERKARGASSFSAFISALITNAETVPEKLGDSVSVALAYHLAGSRVLRLLRAAEERGDGPVLDELREIRRLIVAGQLTFRGAYDGAIDSRNPNQSEWGDDGR